MLSLVLARQDVSLPLVSWNDRNITVADITQLYTRKKNNPELLHQTAQLEALL
ncbi:hypothetical protein [Scytonema sp. NUACC26]|uniref:hypothetical protein n=1 Tax=Scytonema sp. NUACC26 TaxID=3140176 RepID=UPI0034DCC367